ncbi:MAG: TRAP transporter substrate-binding protein [Piscinibacter sp.]|nr:TRAP transporter substrate-binding protein [Piscinibacter sp.]
MLRRTFLLGAGAAALPAHGAAPWRLATGYRAESFHGQNLLALARGVEAATGGALRIELHPNGTLAPLAQILPAVRDGRAEAGETIMTGLAAELPIAGADAVPFITRHYDDARRLWTHQRPLVEPAFAALGLRVLYAVPWPPQGLYSTRPIAVPQDLRGLRMRTYNATTVRIAELLGATPVDVPMLEVGRAVAEGRIDAMITSAVTGVENRVWDGLKHYYDINAWFPKNIVFAREAALRALPDTARDALAVGAAAAEARGWAASQVAARESVEELRRHGVKVDLPPAALATHLRRLGERFALEWIRAVGPQANAIFIPYYSSSTT